MRIRKIASTSNLPVKSYFCHKQIQNMERLVLILFSALQFCLAYDINELANWANNLPILKAHDQAPIPKTGTVHLYLHRKLGHTAKTVCSIPKKIGGIWRDECTILHGNEMLCIDGMAKMVQNGNCKVFIIGSPSIDYTFEKSMVDLGCEIKIYGQNENQEVIKSEQMKVIQTTDSTEDILESLEEDEIDSIFYLKLDLHADNFDSTLKTFMASKLAKNVMHLKIEIKYKDLVIINNKKDLINKLYGNILILDNDHDFKILDYNIDNCQTTADSIGVTFYKESNLKFKPNLNKVSEWFNKAPSTVKDDYERKQILGNFDPILYDHSDTLASRIFFKVRISDFFPYVLLYRGSLFLSVFKLSQKFIYFDF